MILSDVSIRRPIAMSCLIIGLTLLGFNSYRKMGLENPKEPLAATGFWRFSVGRCTAHRFSAVVVLPRSGQSRPCQEGQAAPTAARGRARC